MVSAARSTSEWNPGSMRIPTTRRHSFCPTLHRCRGAYGELLGLHNVAPHASDLIHEGGVGLELEAFLEEVATTLHGHPTLGEAVREAARDTALHLPW